MGSGSGSGDSAGAGARGRKGEGIKEDFRLRLGSLYIGSLSEKFIEIVKILR